jgi:hypothetical protein
MARWNNDLTGSDWLNIFSTLSLLLLYILFITRIAVSLHRNKKSINAFLCLTLTFIGLSIILQQLQITLLMFFPDDPLNLSLFYVYVDLSKGFEVVGVCVDLLRLRLILVS